MIYLDLPSLLHTELRPIAVIIPGLILVIGIDIGLTVPLQPDRELIIVPPGVGHELLGRQVLLSLPLMEVEHQEQQLFRHLGHHREVDHLVRGADGVPRGVLFCLFGEEVVVDPGAVGVGGDEHLVGELVGLLGGEDDLLVEFLELVLEDLVLVADVQVVQVLHERLHVLDGELARGRQEPVGEHGELGLVVLEELYARLALLVVLLLVQVGDLLLDDVLDHVQHSEN